MNLQNLEAEMVHRRVLHDELMVTEQKW